jgi:hypothetical protein
MQRFVSTAVLVVCCTMAPLLASAAVCSSQSTATASIDPSIARSINDLGFRYWSKLGNFAGGQDVALSPLTIWYLNQFTDPGWHKQRVSVASMIETLVRTAGFSASITADRKTVRLNERDVATLASVWCASTRWSKPGDYDVRLDVSLRAKFDLGPRANLKMPFINQDGLTGVRVDSLDGSVELYLLQGSIERLSGFQNSLTERSWETFIGEFHDEPIVRDEISLSRTSYTEVPPESSAMFGARIAAGNVRQRAMFGNNSLTLNEPSGVVTVATAVQGNSISSQLTHETFGNTTVTHYPNRGTASNYDESPRLSNERYFSLVQPLIYIVVNRPTGIVLLIGIHQ